MSDSTFTNEDIEEIGDEDLRLRLQALDEAQSTWEELAYLSNPKMPCPECSGGGFVASGSLGDVCVRCGGDRVIDQPGVESRVDLAQFRPMRAALAAYGEALDDRLFPDDPDGRRAAGGLKSRRNLALPPASSLPTLEAIQALQRLGMDKTRLLGSAPPGVFDPKLLRAPQRAKGLAGEGHLGEYEDAELADMESESDA